MLRDVRCNGLKVYMMVLHTRARWLFDTGGGCVAYIALCRTAAITSSVITFEVASMKVHDTCNQILALLLALP